MHFKQFLNVSGGVLKSKEECKEQELIQSNTTPDIGHHVVK